MRLALLGDVMLGRLVNEALRALPPAYPWGDTLSILRAADAVIVNLECVIVDRGTPQPGKIFTFRCDAKNVAVLDAATVAAVSLANNHSLDYGREALMECLSLLSARGIAVAGAGRSLDDAAAPAPVSIRRPVPASGAVPLTLVACTDTEPAWEAGPRTPGVFYLPLTPEGNDPREQMLLSVIARAAGAGQAVIVSCHWGPNWGAAPPEDHVRFARRLIDAGGAVVFGHSPHVVRGVEVYRGKPILYGCGDFVDDYAVDEVERNDLSCVFVLDYDGRRLRRMLLYPTVIRACQARLAQGVDRETFVERVTVLCGDLGTRTRVIPEGLEVSLDIHSSPDGTQAQSGLMYESRSAGDPAKQLSRSRVRGR